MATVVYKVLSGIDYPPNKRAEIGDEVSDIPSKSIKWLLEIGAIALKSADSDDKTLDKTLDKNSSSEDESPAQTEDSSDNFDDKTHDSMEEE